MAVRELQEIGENLQLIIKRLLANQRLLKLLYYTDKDPFSNIDISNEIIQKEIFEHLIKIVPKFDPKETARCGITLNVEAGSPTTTNSEFQNIKMSFEIITPLTQWIIKDTNLRPFLIISEIIKSLNGKTINGLGKIQYDGFAINFLTTEISSHQAHFHIVMYD